MKKLNSEQMEKVNGGISEARCDRLEKRYWKNFGTKRGNDLIRKMMDKDC